MTERSDLDDFMAENKPAGDAGRKSMLDDYASDIATLRKKRYTIDQICLYLKQKKSVDAKRSTVATFLNRKSGKKARAMQHQNEQPAQTSASETEEKSDVKCQQKPPSLPDTEAKDKPDTSGEKKSTQPTGNPKAKLEKEADKY